LKKKFIWLVIPILLAINIFFKINISATSSYAGYSNMLNFMEAWHHQSPAECYFSPTNTYENLGDKMVKFWPGLTDLQGNCYYTSFPPFSFQWCYFLWWLTGFSKPETVFFIINIIFHFLTALFCMLSVINILKKNNFLNYSVAAIFTFSAVLFTPCTFWFFTDYFFIENSALLLTSFFLFAISNYYKYQSTRNYWITIISILILSYTEAIGYFAAFTFFILLYSESKKWFNNQTLILIISTSLILAFTLFQYSLIEGFEAVIHNFAVRFIGRSGYFGEDKTENHLGVFSGELYSHLWHLIRTGMLGIVLLLVGLIVSLMARIKSNEIPSTVLKQAFWWFISLPILLHFFIFINANALHDQLIVKLVLPFSILCGVMLGMFSSTKISRWLILSIIILVISISKYPVMFAESMGDEGVKEAATEILKYATPNKSLIVICNRNQYYQAPSLFYHSKRNFYLLNDTTAIKYATQKLISTMADSSIIFTIESNWMVLNKKTVENKRVLN
jgi:hypothetical protein